MSYGYSTGRSYGSYDGYGSVSMAFQSSMFISHLSARILSRIQDTLILQHRLTVTSYGNHPQNPNTSTFPSVALEQIGWRPHWAILKSDPNSADKGTLIHVVGTELDLYYVEFRRNYNLRSTMRANESFNLGSVTNAYTSVCPHSEYINEYTPIDTLERLAMATPVPASVTHPLNARGNCRDSLEWYVRNLVNAGILPPSAVPAAEDATSRL